MFPFPGNCEISCKPFSFCKECKQTSGIKALCDYQIGPLPQMVTSFVFLVGGVSLAQEEESASVSTSGNVTTALLGPRLLLPGPKDDIRAVPGVLLNDVTSTPPCAEEAGPSSQDVFFSPY